MFFWKRSKAKQEAPSGRDTLSKSLEANIQKLQNDLLAKDATIAYRRFQTQEPHARDCVLIYANDMTSHESLSLNIIKPMMQSTLPTRLSSIDLADHIMDSVIHGYGVSAEYTYKAVAEAAVGGAGVVLVENCNVGIVIQAQSWEKRAITEPDSESAVRGPRQGFAEDIGVNLSLVRRKIKSTNLKTEFIHVGTETRTKVAVMCVENIAKPELVKEVVARIKAITIDGILESGYIEEFIRDSPRSPFATIGNTERPDVIAAKLLEGRVAVFVDGTPFVLTMPYLFVESFQANEDYFHNWLAGSFHRLLRYISFVITTTTPALYLALIAYHPHLIPTRLVLSIAAARTNVPLPSFVEVVGMGLVFEILREGGIRLPQPVGQAISIVGAIVLGDAAVSAHLISPIMIIVVALTGVSGFVVSQLYDTAVLIRLLLVFLAAILGLHGVVLGVMALVMQLASMKSFGVPYLASLTSFSPQGSKDTMVRAPWWLMILRPRALVTRNRVRLQTPQGDDGQ